MKIGGKIPPFVWLGFMAVIGLALMFGSEFITAGIWGDICRDVGIAILSASILGFTIDRWLKAEIVNNVFEAAMGHVLPKEFQEEIRHVISHNFICEKHQMLVEIETIADDVVRVTASIERKIKNISANAQKQRGYVHVDEWGFMQEKSRILECRIEIPGGDWAVSAETEQHPDLSVSTVTREVSLAPGQSATLVMKAVEIKRINDDLSWVFLAPTINPEIEVKASPGLEFDIGFGTAGEIETSRISKRQRLQGTYFPGQRMRVHWWPKANA